MTGELSIVVSSEIGQLGPTDGKAVIYHVPFYCHIQGFLPCLFLAGLFILKENRNLSALWIIVPSGLLWAVLAIVKYIIGIPTSSEVELNLLFDGLVGGFVAVFLLAERLKRRRFLWGLLVPMFFIGIIYCSGVITDHTIDMAIFLMISALSLWGSLAGARMLCSKHFTVRRFLIGQGVGLFLLLLLLFLLTCYVLSLKDGYPFGPRISEAFIVAAICTAIYFVGQLPFAIIVFVNSFCRKRFEAVFGLKTPATQTVETPQIQTESLME